MTSSINIASVCQSDIIRSLDSFGKLIPRSQTIRSDLNDSDLVALSANIVLKPCTGQVTGQNKQAVFKFNKCNIHIICCNPFY